MIPLWNPVHNLHSLELLWDHVCRCQEIPYAPLTHGLPLANSSSVIDPPPTSPLPSDTPAISRIEDSSQRTCGASDSSPPSFPRANRTLLQDIPFLMSFMRLPPRFSSRLPSLRPRTGDEGDRRGSEHACRLLCWLLPPSNLSDQRACFPLPPSLLLLPL